GVGGTWPRGGRRRITSPASEAIRYVRLDLPPEMSATSGSSQRGSCRTCARSGPTTSGSAPVAIRSRRWAVGSLNPIDVVGGMEVVLSSAGGRDHGGGRRARAPLRRPRAELALMVGRVAELLLAHDDATQVAVRGVLLGEGDPAEDLQGAVGDLAGGARHVGLRHGGRLGGLGQVVVESGGGIEDGRPGAGV